MQWQLSDSEKNEHSGKQMSRRDICHAFNYIRIIYIYQSKKRNVTPLSIFITFLIQTIFYDKLLFSSLYVVMNIEMCMQFISVQL